jgi:Brp/Blh family beta-carotene 15,15'-monooxygenase
VGLYFCLWHSPRHVARVMALDETTASALREVELGRALARFARVAAPLTVAALALIVGFAALVPDPPTTLSGWVGLYLVGIAVLTLPHAAVVTWMDDRQGVWSPTPE